MELFSYVRNHGHEEVAFWHDQELGLRAVIAIHDTTLGPALGGTRMFPYATEEDAVLDVLRLSEAMTYKASMAGLDLGGGKAVIIGDPEKDKCEALFRSFGRFVDSLSGRYITTEDVGTKVEDMAHVAMETRFVTGLPVTRGGSGDPSPLTALGVFCGMKACCEELLERDSLQGMVVAVQGLGKVGYSLVEHLCSEGAEVVASETNPRAIARAQDRLNVRIVDPDKIYDVDCEVFAPCALGASLNDESIPRLRCRIVAGCANNQLLDIRHGDELHRRGILYAPDYVINAGGLISVTSELGAYDLEGARTRAMAIHDNVARVIRLARQDAVPTYVAAGRLARERIWRHKRSLKRASLGVAASSVGERVAEGALAQV